jgi:hypothetical protein
MLDQSNPSASAVAIANGVLEAQTPALCSAMTTPAHGLQSYRSDLKAFWCAIGCTCWARVSEGAVGDRSDLNDFEVHNSSRRREDDSCCTYLA